MSNKQWLVGWKEEDTFRGYVRFKTKKEAKVFARSLIYDTLHDEYCLSLEENILIAKIKKELKP